MVGESRDRDGVWMKNMSREGPKGSIDSLNRKGEAKEMTSRDKVALFS